MAANYPYADYIFYLPSDTRGNAKKLLNTIAPELVIFIKYEFWYHHLSEASYRHIPVLLASAVFRKDQLFFKDYGKFYRRMLFLFRQIFVQDDFSLKLLKDNGITHCTVSGDTRFDRVNFLADQKFELPIVEHFINNEKTIIAGSTWSQDEKLIAESIKNLKEFKIVIAPHEITDRHLEEILKEFPGAIKYSSIKELMTEENKFKGIWSHIDQEQKKALLKKLQDSRYLVIDNVGMLSKLYYYSTFCFVGGGFTRDGIHNVLEPAAYGKVVIFGPNFEKYREAKEMINIGAGFSIRNAEEFQTLLNHHLSDEVKLLSSGKQAREYVKQNSGASQKLVDFIQENRLLTN